MRDAPCLIDTNVISELARKTPDRGVVDFVASQPKLLVSTILFHELAFGVESAGLEHRARLMAFVTAMRDRFGRHAIPVDLAIAETAGRLRALEKAQGRILTVFDALIAGTAMTKGAVLVTRNTKDFKELGVPLVNPFDG
jgi:predicted nucleic acid-binding protein